ncbi:MAG: copper resistance protein NlpE N-terminal domain-containing protein [Pseudoxanthomonas sp.]
MKTNPTLALATVALLLGACTAPAPQGEAEPPAAPVAQAGNPDPAHSAQNSLDWAGAYRGVLPCADCEGIDTLVVLASDGSYSTQSKYKGKGDEIFTEQGSFTWNDAGNTVTLSGKEPVQYFVGENQLTRLAQDGTRIEGELAGKYVLAKQDFDAAITEKYWKLVELNGQPVAAAANEPHFILKAEGGRVIGNGGCNSLTGSYKIDEAAMRISFDRVASTMMACTSGMDVEQAFLEMLRKVDNYSLNGDKLSLNKARMAPLARFEAVYLR